MKSRDFHEIKPGRRRDTLILSAVISVIVSFGELESFTRLLYKTELAWLGAGLFFQIGTYISTAAVWRLTLQEAGVPYSLWTLVPLGVAKLFSEQALPSGGISGTAFFVAALNRRGISTEVCMASLLVSLVSYYTAYIFVAILSLSLLGFYHSITTWIVTLTVLFCLAAVVIPSGVLWLYHRSQRSLPAFLLRIPGLNKTLSMLGKAPDTLLRNARLLTQTTLFQISIFLLDAATLWAMLRAIGQDVSPLATFPSFVIASMAATLGLIPLGLGAFEATSVAMLRKLGVSLEASLTATLLLRGFTLWLPMLPGLWLTRRELTRKPPS